VHIEVGGDDFFIDLLFYHLKLRCYVVVELKAGPFKPEHAGQLNFYLSAVDSQVKAEQDNPSIGLLLCKSQKQVVAEYALRDQKPIGVAEYQLASAESLPGTANQPAQHRADRNRTCRATKTKESPREGAFVGGRREEVAGLEPWRRGS
jgi:hypothetical protein